MTDQETDRVMPPRELIDPDGEGIYLYGEGDDNVLMEAALLFHGDRRLYREVATELAYMRPSEDGETWLRASIGRFPRGWRLNLPKRWRPVLYIYCTPVPS